MNDPEEAIDALLNGLRNADTPTGMERRLFEALAAHASSPSGSASRRRRLPRLSTIINPALHLPLACSAALALVAISFFVTPRPRSRDSRIPAAETHATPAQASPSPSSALLPGTTPVPPRKIKLHRDQPVRDVDLVALSEMHAVSKPAPPLPLTKQEKLLLRIAHSGDPEELTTLNPELRAQQLAESKAAVYQFFNPPTSPDNE